MNEEGRTWIHVLLKGEKSADDEVSNAHDDYLEEFARRSLIAILIPPLQFRYKNLEKLKTTLIRSTIENNQLGLIITSPRVVEAISRAFSCMNNLERTQLAQKLNPSLIFPIARKTAIELKKKTSLDYNCCATESGDSAKLAEYVEKHANSTFKATKLIYPKGSLASSAIEDRLSKNTNLSIETLIVYETNIVEDIGDTILEKLEGLVSKGDIKCHQLCINFIFFSPSGVKSFKSNLEKIKTGLDKMKCSMVFSSIGQTTENAIKCNGLEVSCVAEQPNARSLVDCVVEACSKKMQFKL